MWACQTTIGALVVDSVLDPKEYMPKVEAAVRKALELDETLAEAHVALGNFLRERWDWAGAEREYQRAIALNPSLAAAQRSLRRAFSAIWGATTQAIAEVTRARELDPLNPLPARRSVTDSFSRAATTRQSRR